LNNKRQAITAYNYGRSGGLIHQLGARFYHVANHSNLTLDYTLNPDLLKKALQAEFSAFESPARESQILVGADPTTFTFTKENNGRGFNYKKIIDNTDKQLRAFKNAPLEMILGDQIPTITQTDAETLRPQITRLNTLNENLIVFYNDSEVKAKLKPFATWLEIARDDANNLVLTVKKDMLTGTLESLGQHVNREPSNAKFQMKDGKVVEFSVSRNGQALDFDATYTAINQALVTDRLATPSENKELRLAAIVKETEPEVSTGSVNDLGIKELIGVGKSNFSGSPTNRRTNIGVGAAKLNGVLIAPGEEFSLIKTLGSIDAENGFLPELVIKGDRTIPEFGGGLCQVGTTTFRMALDAGLPITERRNHSYRVRYYEPAGTDATIYDPKPDFRFVNDTGKHILVQTIVDGDNLRFEMWGTKDGRTVYQSTPKIYNITQPGPTKLVESEELKPGEKKCVETAHPGADASFTRTVTYADGTNKEEEWKSHYVPWQQVCLVGKDPNATPVVDPNAPPADTTPPLTPDTAPPVTDIPPVTTP
jgi:vancomycin resistance protein YoaR